jgi:hypothetical protein
MLDAMEDMLNHVLICHHTPDPKQSDYWDLLDTVKPLLRMSNQPCDLTPPCRTYLTDLSTHLLTKHPYLSDMLQYQADQEAGKIPSHAPTPLIRIGTAPTAPKEDPVEPTHLQAPKEDPVEPTPPLAPMRHPHQPDAPTPITQDDHIMLDAMESMCKQGIICHFTPTDAPIQPMQSNFWHFLDTVKPLLCMQNLPCDLTPPAEPTLPTI